MQLLLPQHWRRLHHYHPRPMVGETEVQRQGTFSACIGEYAALQAGISELFDTLLPCMSAKETRICFSRRTLRATMVLMFQWHTHLNVLWSDDADLETRKGEVRRLTSRLAIGCTLEIMFHLSFGACKGFQAVLGCLDRVSGA